MSFKHFSISLVLFSLLSTFSWGQGIQFSEGSWDEIKAKAKAENKYIFVDAYAVWCGPCKWMAKTVFTEASVGQHFNSKFINYKFDMEKGEGPAFAKQHAVVAYPTLLFFNSEGELVHKAVGAQPVKELLVVSENALDPKKQIFTLQKKFKAGERSIQFLYDYTMALAGAYEDATEPSKLYLAAIDKKDWSKKKNFELIMNTQNDYKSDVVNYVIQNKSAFVQENTAELVHQFFQMLFYSKMNGVLESNTEEGYQALRKDLVQLVGKDNAAKYKAMLDYNYFAGTSKAFKYQKKYFDKYCDNSSELNQIAWQYFESEDNKNKLLKALSWADRSIQLEKNWFNLDTKANLLYKLGRLEAAKTTAEEAIKVCKEAGDDPTETQKLLDKINEQKG